MTTTPVLSIKDPDAIPAAKKIIENQGLIVFPTDTIYGVAADAHSAKGVQRIYAAKERSEDKALPVLIGDLTQLEDLVLFVTEEVRLIAEHFWPGALTLILPKSSDVPAELSPYPTIGIRMPDLAFTLSLLKQTGPLAATSANISGGPNPVTARDVLNQLDGRVDLILDGGATPGPAASTVVDASGPALKILREGPVALADLQALINEA